MLAVQPYNPTNAEMLSTIMGAILGLTNRVDRIEHRLDASEKTTKERFDRLENYVFKRFDAVDKRFDAQDKKFAALQNLVQGYYDKLANRFEKIEQEQVFTNATLRRHELLLAK